MAQERWTRRPEGSTWGDYGPDDELGRINLLTPQKVLEGVAEVREGRTFCLSLPLDLPGGNALHPRRLPPVLSPTMRGAFANYNYPMSREGTGFNDIICDDQATLYLQYSTHWDALSHIGAEFDVDGSGTPRAVYYNGFRADSDVVGPVIYESGEPRPSGASTGARKLGVEIMAAARIQGRGVMIDLEAHFGRDHRAVGYDDMMRVLDADQIEVEAGDIVCLHTGFADMIVSMGGNPDAKILHASCASLDGRDEKLLQWISDSKLAAIAADNYAVEMVPARVLEKHGYDGASCCSASLPLHRHCLFRMGIPLGELWYLTELATWLREHQRSRLLLTAPPLRLPGAVGAPLTPVATV